MKKQEQVFTIEAVTANRPEMTLKQALTWDYFFENGWTCIATDQGSFVIMDEGLNLNKATVLPNEDGLYEWLDFEADELMDEDPQGFFGSFFRIPSKDCSSLLTKDVMAAMIAAVGGNEND